MDPRDEDYEVLDSGASEDPANARVDGLPALDLGERTSGSDDAQGARAGRAPMPPWQRWAAIAVAVVVGVFAGAYVWHARSESAELAAAAEGVDLIAGPVVAGPAVAGPIDGASPLDRFRLIQQPLRLVVELHNAGDRAIDVRNVRLPGWQLPNGADRRSISTVGPGEWRTFGLVGETRCVGSVPQHVDVDIRTEAGDASIIVPLPPADLSRQWSSRMTLADVYGSACPDVTPRLIFADAINARRSAVDPKTLQMGVQLLVPGPEAEISDVNASAAGLRGAGRALPVPAGGSHRSVTVSVDWRIDNCADTAEIAEATLDIEIGGRGETATVPVALPNRAVAVLARFTAEECGR